MLQTLLPKTLKDVKNPVIRLFFIVTLIAISVLFSLLINILFSNSNDYKAKSVDLEAKLDKVTRTDQKTIDSLKDASFNDHLNFYIEKDRYSKQLDSLIEKISKIK